MELPFRRMLAVLVVGIIGVIGIDVAQAGWSSSSLTSGNLYWASTMRGGVAIDGAGATIVVGASGFSPSRELKVWRGTASGFDAGQTIAALDGSMREHPSIAAVGQVLHVAWSDAGAIWYRSYDGSSWGAAVQVSAQGECSSQPTMLVDDTGKPTILWWDDTPCGSWGMNVLESHLDGGSWTTPTTLIAGAGLGGCLHPDYKFWADASPDGSRFIVATSTASGFAVRRFHQGTWSSVEYLSGSYSYCYSAAINNAGVAAASWSNGQGRAVNVYASRFDGSSWGAATTRAASSPANTTNANYVTSTVSLDAAGNAYFVWPGKYSKFSSGAWGDPLAITGVAATDWYNHYATVSSTGVLTVVAARTVSGDSMMVAYRMSNAATSASILGGNGSADLYALATGPNDAIAIAWTGTSNGTAIFSPATPDAPAPTAISQTASGTVSASFTGADGGTPITSRTVTCESSDGGTTVTATVSNPSTSAQATTLSGLSPNKTYSCRAADTNAIGVSGNSSATSSLLVAGTPTPPTTVSAALTANQTFEVAFSGADPRGAAIASYTVSCVSSDGGTTRTVTGAASPLTVASLTLPKTYTCTVTATNTWGTSSASIPTSALTSAIAPSPPSISSVEVLPGSGVRVSLQPGYDGNRPIEGYAATCTSTDGGATRQAESVSSPVTITGLTANRTYTCTATARNQLGVSSSSGQSASFLTSKQLTVLAIVGSGRVTDATGVLDCETACIAPLVPDAAATITATPAAGWAFSSWGGACTGTSRTCSVMMNQAREVTVTFVPAPAAPQVTPEPSAPTAGSSASPTPKTPKSPRITTPKVKGRRATTTFAAETGTRYAITARSGKQTKQGRCAVRGKQVTCAISLGKGRWVLSVTPTRGRVVGTAAKRTITIS